MPSCLIQSISKLNSYEVRELNGKTIVRLLPKTSVAIGL